MQHTLSYLPRVFCNNCMKGEKKKFFVCFGKLFVFYLVGRYLDLTNIRLDSSDTPSRAWLCVGKKFVRRVAPLFN
jgi:hypothetical protein